jgi:hypothetical protein
MKNTKKLLAALFMLGALAGCGSTPTVEPTAEPTQQPTEEATVAPSQDTQSGLKESLVNVAVGKTVYLSTVGQADSNIIENIIKKAGAVGQYTANNMLTADQVEEGAVVLLTLGSSSKGLGAAGVDEAHEKARAEEFAAAAKAGKFTLVLFHVGGTTRRGTSSDPIIEAAFPGSAACFVVAEGNTDKFFTNLASKNSVKLYSVEKTLGLVDYAKGLFGL